MLQVISADFSSPNSLGGGRRVRICSLYSTTRESLTLYYSNIVKSYGGRVYSACQRFGMQATLAAHVDDDRLSRLTDQVRLWSSCMPT